MPGRPSLSALLPTMDCKHLKGKHHEGHEFLMGVPGCVIGRHEVSLQKEDMLKCPDDEIGSSPGSGAGLQKEGESSLFTTTEDKSVDMMGCDRGT